MEKVGLFPGATEKKYKWNGIIYKDGKILKILVDTVRPGGGLSGKEKYNDYGIKRVSGIGKEWWEEVVSFEILTEQNGLDALQMDNEGHALNEDVISSATIRVSYYAEVIQDALNR